ncbi:MAG: hypothetical protein Harvfovirus70_5 [Harvfovirus sp.]|uniref:Uncharacterized protein n=1 Tax=Harvfovirus sp. TaxID=2487768 RepID=A0A3G5A924_9VIRU|nr:MAG: hypothetical protein Harvfovirus70_5 [Harvfovirus sp.]
MASGTLGWCGVCARGNCTVEYHRCALEENCKRIAVETASGVALSCDMFHTAKEIVKAFRQALELAKQKNSKISYQKAIIQSIG